jgi:hypothetical protein
MRTPGIPFAETLDVVVLPICGFVVYIETPFFWMSKIVFAETVGKTLSQKSGTPRVELITNGNGARMFVKFAVVSVVVSSDMAPPIIRFDWSLRTLDCTDVEFVWRAETFDRSLVAFVCRAETFDRSLVAFVCKVFKFDHTKFKLL